MSFCAIRQIAQMSGLLGNNTRPSELPAHHGFLCNSSSHIHVFIPMLVRWEKSSFHCMGNILPPIKKLVKDKPHLQRLLDRSKNKILASHA